MDTLFVKWCPDPMPPTYRCKQPNASACPVRITASGVFWHFSKLVCAICATNEVSFMTCAIRPSASPAAQRKMLSVLASASCTNELACARTVFSPNSDLFSARFYDQVKKIICKSKAMCTRLSESLNSDLFLAKFYGWVKVVQNQIV